MAKRTRERGNDYYLKRLKGEHPNIYADLNAGKYGSVAEALRTAGLKRERTRLQELKNAWDKATQKERDSFKVFIGCPVTVLKTPASSLSIATGLRLQPWAIRRIKQIMDRRRLRVGEVMTELGFKPLNTSLGMALARETQLDPSVLLALERWLETNKAV
ncbi:MAG: hypothetical protein KDK08_26720 [Rhizobiaceae bacterium]|nr:hypothetical protein [Rhizobiaceae bacterium]